jgi:hypothetical protein
MPRLGRFTPGKDIQYQLYSRKGEPQGRPGREINILSHPGFQPQKGQRVTRFCLYRGADKSLARPGRKQATTEDFEFHISYL